MQTFVHLVLGLLLCSVCITVIHQGELIGYIAIYNLVLFYIGNRHRLQ